MVAADWDGDGDPDLIIGNIDGGVFFVPNKGTPRKPAFGKAEVLQAEGKPIVAEGSRAGPAVADWDGDGKLDLILGSGAGAVTWYRNLGTLTAPKLASPATLITATKTEAATAETTGAPTRSGGQTKVFATDWNGDGQLDLLVGDDNPGGDKEYHGWVWVYLRKKPTN